MNDSPLTHDKLDDVSELLDHLSVCKSLVKKTEQSITTIRLLTSGFEILADCDLNGNRLLDVMNQSISDYLECTGAALYHNTRLIERADQLKIRKPEIMIAGIAGKTHEAQEKRIGSRRKLDLFQAFVAVDRWIVKGRLYMTSNKTVKEFLNADRDFFPIADANIIDAESPDEPQQVPVAIVNRSRVSFMEITELDKPEIDPHRSAISALLNDDTLDF